MSSLRLKTSVAGWQALTNTPATYRLRTRCTDNTAVQFYVAATLPAANDIGDAIDANTPGYATVATGETLYITAPVDTTVVATAL